MFIISELFSDMSSIDIRDRSLTFWDGGMFSIRENFFLKLTRNKIIGYFSMDVKSVMFLRKPQILV